MLTWLLRSLYLPSVSLIRPLSPFLFPFALACSCYLAWFPLLLHRWKLLNFIVLKRMQKRVATKEYVRKLRGLVSQNLISNLVCTSFGPRLNCSQSKLSPERFWKGFAMVCCLVCCCCCCCCLCCCFWARRGFWEENEKIYKRTGSCAEETKSIRILPGSTMGKWMKGLIDMK